MSTRDTLAFFLLFDSVQKMAHTFYTPICLTYLFLL